MVVDMGWDAAAAWRESALMKLRLLAALVAHRARILGDLHSHSIVNAKTALPPAV